MVAGYKHVVLLDTIFLNALDSFGERHTAVLDARERLAEEYSTLLKPTHRCSRSDSTGATTERI